VGIDQLVIGTADMQRALALWRDTLGFTVYYRGERADPLPGSEALVQCDALLGFPDTAAGQLHLVEFAAPGAPVRQGAGLHDACPKTVNLLCRDLPAVHARLEAAGHRFRSHWVAYEKHGVHYRDVHMAGPDASNIGLLEVLGADYPVGDNGIGAVAAVCFTQQSLDGIDGLCRDVLGQSLQFDETLGGPELELMLALPPGATLEMRLYGPAAISARFEFVRYAGASGANLYARAQAPATGILYPRLTGLPLAALRTAYAAAAPPGVTLQELGRSIVLGTPVESVQLVTGGGFSVQVCERLDQVSRQAAGARP
jgi:catechol 2,3-dioxygenase-like lactoylglutathione lyase family enzyme